MHACLTTYYGLHELLQVDYELLYGRTFTEADYKTDERLRKLAEIYSYDYMDLDKIYSQLTKTGHAIVDRRKPLKSDEEKI